MLLSWSTPWWRAVILEIDRYIQIRPWGLEHNLGDFAGYIAGAEMPAWFAPFMWTYLGICVLLLLASLFAKEKGIRFGKFELSLPQALIMGVGLSYIVVVVVAAVYASIRLGDYWDVKLIGRTYVQIGDVEHSYVETGFLFGYWLACAVGPLCVVLGLLRNKIIGNPKPLSA
jgi:hypothetical protein